MWLPEDIENRIRGKFYTENTTGMSGASVLMFEDMVLKIQPVMSQTRREPAMLRWLCGRLPVPEVISYEEHDGTGYCLMTRLTGRMACEAEFLERPQILIPRLAEAIQMLWAVDVAGCPVCRDPDVELAEARERVEKGFVDIDNTEPETFGPGGFQNPEALLHWLEQNRPSYEPVLSHGDLCLPNIFLTENGISGFIDLGDAGVGDRWRDIALCHRSLRHNTDGSYGSVKKDVNPDELFSLLGIRPDPEKLRWYLLLDELF